MLIMVGIIFIVVIVIIIIPSTFFSIIYLHFGMISKLSQTRHGILKTLKMISQIHFNHLPSDYSSLVGGHVFSLQTQ